MALDRGQFSSRAGFILAAAGSAVGLGNIWKFPYVTGANGGAAFLFIYLVIVYSVGLSVMLAELVVGRAAARNPVGAYRTLKGGGWPLVGFIGVAAGFMILSFYQVVAGWTLAYIVEIFGGLLDAPNPKAFRDAYDGFISDPYEPIFWSAIFMGLTIGVVVRGVASGIERASKVLMPALFILVLILIARSVTLPGAEKGLTFFFNPDFSKVTGETILAALGLAFFTLSLGMGAMLTYGSYLDRRSDLPGSALWVTGLDSIVAILAGLIILPAVFAFGFDPSQGPGLTFVTLPAVFAQIPAGEVFAVAFFVLLAVAALTSSVSLLEVVVAYFVDEQGMNRVKAATIFGTIIFLLGIPSSLSFGVLGKFTIAGKNFFDAIDFISSNILLPAGGIGVAIFAGWIIHARALREATGDGMVRFAWAPYWSIIVKYIAPVAIVLILINGLGLI